MTLTLALTVMLAGAVGTLARYGISRAFARTTGFPWAVLIVNAAGSAIGGVVLGLVVAAGLSTEWRLVVLTGICGGLTTFSTFGVETVQLIQGGRAQVAILSVLGNLALGVGLAAVGYLVVIALA